ncbi:MAG TPA: hypothetical protein VN581_02970, partial [Patescibacteria group bacterium]|nr:hypothetical protein [Patescibacteria group bacterium]
MALLYLGICFSALISFVLYTVLEVSDPMPQRNMNPLVVIFTPMLALVTLSVAVTLELFVFDALRHFQRNHMWLALGLAYGLFWTCYPFVSVSKSSSGSLIWGCTVAIGGAVLVHLRARRAAHRVEGSSSAGTIMAR